MINTKDAKFYCESCGSEVPRKSKFCPTCGRFFASVRCPQCGKTGSNDDFKNGCPDCGYAVNKGNFSQNKLQGNKNHNSTGIFASIFNRNFISKSKTNGDGSLPIWIYFLCIVVLLILVVCLYSCL